MKSDQTSSLLADDAPVAPAPAADPFRYHTPNSAGIFEQFDQFFVPMSGGNICHLLVAGDEDGNFYQGHKFFTRQPRNLLTELPSTKPSARFICQKGALRQGAALALRFFIDHKPALEALYAWIEENLPADLIETLREEACEIGLTAWGKAKTIRGEEPVAAEPLALGEKINRAVAGEPEVDAGANSRSGASEAAGFHTPSEAGGESVAALGTTPAPAPTSDAADTVPPRPRYAELRLEEIGTGNNPRKQRDREKQAELVENLRGTPLLHPVVVRDLGKLSDPRKPRYELIAGEGRWLAYQELKRPTIEARVFAGVDRATALAWALVENLQRSDLNAMEEAEGFHDLEQMGWTPARMAEQTGKTTRTIRRALGLMKLPDAVRQLVRANKLTPRHAAALARWVVPAGFADGEAAAGFVARPDVCEIIAQVAADEEISGRELEQHAVPLAALPRLIAGKWVASIAVDYVERFGAERVRGDEFKLALGLEDCAELAVFSVGGETYTFDVAAWRAAKRVIDAQDRQAEAEKAAKAAQRVAAASENKVTVPIVALKQSHTEHVVLKGELERYVDHLPENIVVPGIDPATKGEVFVCTQPEQLKKLRDAEAAEIAKQDAAVLRAHLDLALDRVKKLKRIGSRELALVMAGGTVYFDAGVFKTIGLRAPKDWTEIGNDNVCEHLAKFAPLDQVRVMLAAMLPTDASALRTDDEGLGVLRWILERPKLGLVGDDKREAERVLARVAKEVFPPAAGFRWDGRGVCENPSVICIDCGQADCELEVSVAQRPDKVWVNGVQLKSPKSGYALSCRANGISHTSRALALCAALREAADRFDSQGCAKAAKNVRSELDRRAAELTGVEDALARGVSLRRAKTAPKKTKN